MQQDKQQQKLLDLFWFTSVATTFIDDNVNCANFATVRLISQWRYKLWQEREREKKSQRNRTMLTTTNKMVWEKSCKEEHSSSTKHTKWMGRKKKRMCEEDFELIKVKAKARHALNSWWAFIRSLKLEFA